MKIQNVLIQSETKTKRCHKKTQSVTGSYDTDKLHLVILAM